jgi:hypothetical protein
MRLQLIDQVTAPGDAARPNEDAWCASESFAAALDGATGLGEPLLEAPSDAAWLSNAGAEALMRRAPQAHGRDLLKAVLTELERRFLDERLRAPTEMYELPMASAVMVQAAGADALTALWYGDCCSLVERPGAPVEVVGDVSAKRSEEAERASRAAASIGRGPAGSLRTPEVLAALRADRNRWNQPGGPWTFAPDARCAEHSGLAAFAAPPGTWLLLATDGFTALATDYGRFSLPALLGEARARGLATVLDEVRAVERADPEGRAYPRFKVSDDATALLLRVL